MRFLSALVAASLLACSSSNVHPPLDVDHPDASTSGECHATASSATCAPAPVTCAEPITHPWGIEGRDACFLGDLHAFYTACITGTPAACAAFKSDAKNAKCLSCLVHPESDKTWGPVMEAANGLYAVNVASCDYGRASPPSCLARKTALEACERAACASSCGGSAGDPAAQAAFTACMAAAKLDPASCAPFADGDCRPDADACRSGRDFGGDFYRVAGDACILPNLCIPAEAPVDPPGYGGTAPLHQNACSASQIDAYLKACDGEEGGTPQTCNAYRASGDYAKCGTCLETSIGAASWGPVVNLNFESYMLNEAGCVEATVTDPALRIECQQAIYARDACAFAQCSCVGIVVPYDDCSIAAFDSACAAKVGPARDCEAKVAALGGEAAKCVAHGATMTTDLRAMMTTYCGP